MLVSGKMQLIIKDSAVLPAKHNQEYNEKLSEDV